MSLSLPRSHQGLGFYMTWSAIDLVGFIPYRDRSDDPTANSPVCSRLAGAFLTVPVEPSLANGHLCQSTLRLYHLLLNSFAALVLDPW